MTPLFGVATRPRLGESVNGDATVVRPFASGTLFAVIDALGHGPQAAAAARVAVAFLENPGLDGDIHSIVCDLDRALKGTRGAAATIGFVVSDRLSCCAIGNVDVRTHGVRLPVTLTPGVLGNGLRRACVFGGPLGMGSRLALFSDGISGRFSLAETAHLAPTPAGRSILEAHGRSSDDATVLIMQMR